MDAGSSISIRRAHEGDNRLIAPLQEQIAALHRAGRPDYFKSEARLLSDAAFAALLADGDQYVLIAEAGGRVVGYAFAKVIRYRNHSTYNDFDMFYIDDICVDAGCRRNGAGRALFEACRERAEELRCRSIDLGVWSFNSDAIAFYESLGMTERMRRMELTL